MISLISQGHPPAGVALAGLSVRACEVLNARNLADALTGKWNPGRFVGDMDICRLLQPGEMNRNSYLKADVHGERHTPPFRCDELVQEVRSVENAPTWRRLSHHHPHRHICRPYSNRPHGNGCGQGSCCRDGSFGLSCSLATDHRL